MAATGVIRFSVIPSRPCLGRSTSIKGLEAARDRIYDWFKSLFESALEVKPLKGLKNDTSRVVAAAWQVVT